LIEQLSVGRGRKRGGRGSRRRRRPEEEEVVGGWKVPRPTMVAA